MRIENNICLRVNNFKAKKQYYSVIGYGITTIAFKICVKHQVLCLLLSKHYIYNRLILCVLSPVSVYYE
jgi:hypothetical protein